MSGSRSDAAKGGKEETIDGTKPIPEQTNIEDWKPPSKIFMLETYIN